jgi:hypothetical protein
MKAIPLLLTGTGISTGQPAAASTFSVMVPLTASGKVLFRCGPSTTSRALARCASPSTARAGRSNCTETSGLARQRQLGLGEAVGEA